MTSLEDIAKFIGSVMKEYGFKTKEVGYHYPAGTMDNTLLRAIEGIYFYGGTGYIYIAGRNGDEYVSGNDRTLAVRWNGDRPNIPYLIVTGTSSTKKYYDNVMLMDRGGGYVDESWVEPEEHGGIIEFQQLNYTHPVDDNMYIGTIYRTEEEISSDISSICEIAAHLLGNYMIINQGAPDSIHRYDHLIMAIRSVIPTFSVSTTGQCKIPYYDLYVTM